MAGELGESVYGLNADFKPPVGEGMSCVAVAMPHLLGRPTMAARWRRVASAAPLLRLFRKMLAVGLPTDDQVDQLSPDESRKAER